MSGLFPEAIDDYVSSVYIAMLKPFTKNWYQGYQFLSESIEVLDVELPVKPHGFEITTLRDAEDKSYMTPEQHFYTSRCTICPNKPSKFLQFSWATTSIHVTAMLVSPYLLPRPKFVKLAGIVRGPIRHTLSLVAVAQLVEFP